MQIYTGNCYGKDIEVLKELGVGIMIASSASSFKPSKDWKGLPLALDNGAFQCYRLGYPFMEAPFFDTLFNCYKLGLKLNFIVCPDIVGGGPESTRFSLYYAEKRFAGCRNLAFAVQDGMNPRHVAVQIKDYKFSTIFVGGTVEWKWETLPLWVEVAHEAGIKCHVGRCGKLDNLKRAADLGVDSVDSVSFVRNKSWDIIRKFQNE